eukprot:GCRY01004933.1.p1 GENE.GCRY01004933.1~~GCRY01004933.1.p1  ORF type:complete len:107 (-),score=3.76 GCRY01004933.1:47-367(-)
MWLCFSFVLFQLYFMEFRSLIFFFCSPLFYQVIGLFVRMLCSSLITITAVFFVFLHFVAFIFFVFCFDCCGFLLHFSFLSLCFLGATSLASFFFPLFITHYRSTVS